MTIEDFDRTLSELLHRDPFQAFVVELNDGRQIVVDKAHSMARRSGSAIYAPTIKYQLFKYSEVKRFVELPKSMQSSKAG